MKNPTIDQIKAQITEGAVFELKMGNLVITNIEKDGYGKGVDTVKTMLNNNEYADTIIEISHFIIENLKK